MPSFLLTIESVACVVTADARVGVCIRTVVNYAWILYTVEPHYTKHLTQPVK